MELSRSLIPIESTYKLWKLISKSPELASLNESLVYGDQSLSTHLLLTLNFGAHLIHGKTAYVVAKVVPQNKKNFFADITIKSLIPPKMRRYIFI
ncbi:MAG: hypothetical protein ACFFD2_00160 [Promethearchaeota archaeon]